MTRSSRSRQKKLEKKKKQRDLKRKRLNIISLGQNRSSVYAKYPVHECLVPDSLERNGLGNVVIARAIPDGSIAVSTFLVDLYCLGVKDAFFTVISEIEYDEKLKAGVAGVLEPIHPACARKLINGAVLYAKNLGFSPHRDYHKAKGLLGDIDAKACPVAYSYGQDGKPFYVSGPNESTAQAKQIVRKLHKTAERVTMIT